MFYLFCLCVRYDHRFDCSPFSRHISARCTKRLLAWLRRSLLLDDVMLECTHDTFKQSIFIVITRWLWCFVATFDSNEACSGVIVIVISHRCCARIRSRHINQTTFQWSIYHVLAHETHWNLNHVFVFDTIDLVRCRHDAIVICNSFDVDSIVNQRMDDQCAWVQMIESIFAFDLDVDDRFANDDVEWRCDGVQLQNTVQCNRNRYCNDVSIRLFDQLIITMHCVSGLNDCLVVSMVDRIQSNTPLQLKRWLHKQHISSSLKQYWHLFGLTTTQTRQSHNDDLSRHAWSILFIESCQMNWMR